MYCKFMKPGVDTDEDVENKLRWVWTEEVGNDFTALVAVVLNTQ